ncbi:MAG: hypothetical protein J7L82_05810 [Staphylothermus sp.]|nr:hypothetical protein [Staphylothermus sp.]
MDQLGALFYKQNVTIKEGIVDYQVSGEFLGIRTSDNNLFLFHKPSFIGYVKKPFYGLGALAIVVAAIMIVFDLYPNLKSPTMSFGIPTIIGIILVAIGLFFLFYKKRVLLVETHSGLHVTFTKPENIDLEKIFTSLVKEYKPESTTERPST